MSEVKIVMLGGGGVGKSAFVIQHIQHHFVDEYDPTIEDSYRKQMMYDDRSVLSEILDTAGQEEYCVMRDQFIFAGEAFVLLFSLTSRDSFEFVCGLKDAIERVKEVSVSEVPCMLVGNKSDLVEGREVSAEEGERLAAEWGMPYVEASAKTRENVDYVFVTLALRLLAMRDNPPRPSTGFFSKLKHRLRRGGGATTKTTKKKSKKKEKKKARRKAKKDKTVTEDADNGGSADSGDNALVADEVPTATSGPETSSASASHTGHLGSPPLDGVEAEVAGFKFRLLRADDAANFVQKNPSRLKQRMGRGARRSRKLSKESAGALAASVGAALSEQDTGGGVAGGELFPPAPTLPAGVDVDPVVVAVDTEGGEEDGLDGGAGEGSNAPEGLVAGGPGPVEGDPTAIPDLTVTPSYDTAMETDALVEAMMNPTMPAMGAVWGDDATDPTVTVAIPGLDDGAGVDPTVGHADGDETVDSTIPSSLEGVDLAVPGGGRDRADSRVVLAVSPSLNIISPEELEVGDKLGEGGFGQVFRGTYYHTPVAVKVFPPLQTSAAASAFIREVTVLCSVGHPNTVRILGVYEDVQGDHAIVFEYMPGGDLKHFMARHGSAVTTRIRLNILFEAAAALQYLHEGCRPALIHGDVKPHNILLTTAQLSSPLLHARLADFGLANAVGDGSVRAYTPAYAAPEVRMSGTRSRGADAWSLAVVMVEVLLDIHPILHDDDLFLPPFQSRAWEALLTKDGGVLAGLCMLVEMTWSAEATERAAVGEVADELQSAIREVMFSGGSPRMIT